MVKIKHTPKFTAKVQTETGHILTVEKEIRFKRMREEVQTYLEVNYPTCKIIEIKEN